MSGPVVGRLRIDGPAVLATRESSGLEERSSSLLAAASAATYRSGFAADGGHLANFL